MLRPNHGLLSACTFLFVAASAAGDEVAWTVRPAEVRLTGNFEGVQLLATAVDSGAEPNERSRDLTTQATFASSDAGIVTVDERGRLLAVANGTATITVTAAGVSRDVPVTVEGISEKPAIGFDEHVRPILNKQGCAAAACHASQHGKGGFKLSVFGYDPQADHQAMTRDGLLRRTNPIAPEQSLILLKPTMAVSHGGGHRLTKGSADYEILRAWIAGGAPGPMNETPEVTQLAVTPSRRIAAAGDKQQLRVEAAYSSGVVRDVTAWAKFDSMDEGMLAVDERGLVTVSGQGQAPIMIRFEGHAATAMFLVPYGSSAELAGWQSNNLIDELAAAKFRELGIEPSPLCDDAAFVRRAYFDGIGAAPTKEETLAFLESADPKKREKLIDQLLGLTGDPQLDIYNDRYAAWWTLKWSDLIRNNSNDLGDQGMWALHNWIKEAFRTNKPFDQFVRELITAKGSIYSNGPANYYRINKDSSALTESTAQLFLGVRLECAKCHHHPFEKYSQADYYGVASFFARVGTKNSEEFGLFGREQIVLVRESGDVRHPRTGQVMKPTTLDGAETEHALDRRIALAEWLTSKDNDYFARNVVNRYFGYLLGRGLVEPIDDLRSSNPPSNVELMNALAEHIVEYKFDLKQLIRTIMTSRLYQLDSQPTEQNAADDRFYGHYRVKRLTAEPLLDAVDYATAAATKFPNLPLGTRATDLPDAEYPNFFLTTFAKPRRASVCECERAPHENLAQALHTLNGDILAQKISDKNGRVARLLAGGALHEEIVTELYLVTLCREPSEAEVAASHEFLAASPTPQECYEDLLWALLNSKHFLYVH
jgi:hypothetical protein